MTATQAGPAAMDMRLHALLGEVHSHWLDGCVDDGDGALDPALQARGRDSVLGRRLLCRWLASGAGAAVLAPAPGEGAASVVSRWPRPRLMRLIRDLGSLAFAPAIRAEIRREPVRILKGALGTSYLLALDPVVWDGHVDREVALHLQRALAPTLVAPADEPGAGVDASTRPLLDVLDRQGRAELAAWSRRNDPPLGAWLALLHPPEEYGPAHLPDATVLKLCMHHATRGAA